MNSRHFDNTKDRDIQRQDKSTRVEFIIVYRSLAVDETVVRAAMVDVVP